LFSKRLAVSIVAAIAIKPLEGQRGGFVDTTLIFSGKDHTGTTGVDKALDCVLTTRRQYVFGAAKIGVVERPRSQGDTGQSRGVKNALHTTARSEYGLRVANVPLPTFHAQRVDF
jgi:hypothetical protein